MKTDVERTTHYTTNYQKICEGLVECISIPLTDTIVEPFCGTGELLNLLPTCQWETYDIAPVIETCAKKDTLLNPPNYNNKWVITNPPWLAKNKAKDKTLFEIYPYDDLYKITLSTILNAKGGIMIVPTNFFTDKASAKIRTEFLDTFKILRVNVFTSPVFDTTTYSTCAFAFCKHENKLTSQDILFYCDEKSSIFTLDRQYNYRLGGEWLSIVENYPSIFSRLVFSNSSQGYITNINAVCIDTREHPFHLEWSEEPYYGKLTDRNVATLVSDIPLTKEQQVRIITRFNQLMKEKRQYFNNLLFTNYRDFNRKRVGFDFIYACASKILKEGM